MQGKVGALAQVALQLQASPLEVQRHDLLQKSPPHGSLCALLGCDAHLGAGEHQSREVEGQHTLQHEVIVG